MWTAKSTVGDRYRGTARAQLAGSESHVEAQFAPAARFERTGVGLAEIRSVGSGQRDAADRHRRGTVLVSVSVLSSADSSDQLRAKLRLAGERLRVSGSARMETV